MMCLIVRKFLPGASRFVVGALHSLAPLGYGTSIYLEVGTEFFYILIYFKYGAIPNSDPGRLVLRFLDHIKLDTNTR